jgi:hypothetical protein
MDRIRRNGIIQGANIKSKRKGIIQGDSMNKIKKHDIMQVSV